MRKTALPVASFVATAGLVDAAFSGDWSRIGVLSTDAEDALKALCAVVAAERALLAFLLSKQGAPPLKIAKAVGCGTPSVWRDLRS